MCPTTRKSIITWSAATLGMLSFAGTFPVTRFLIDHMSALHVGSGRVIVAGLIGAAVLLVTRAPLPATGTWRYLALAAAGVALGFPLLSAAALTDLNASSAAVSAGVLPLLTALAAMLVAGERPRQIFWWACGSGCAVVILQALFDAQWHWQARNSLFFAAMLCAALGYAAGARITRQMPAWQVSCWLVVIATPLNALLLLWLGPGTVSLGSGTVSQDTVLLEGAILSDGAALWVWAGFAYLVIFSQLLGFVCWNHALAHGGIARVGQLQLLQPFITLFIAGLWLGETLSPLALVTLLLVIASIVVGRRGIAQRPPIEIQTVEN